MSGKLQIDIKKSSIIAQTYYDMNDLIISQLGFLSVTRHNFEISLAFYNIIILSPHLFFLSYHKYSLSGSNII